MSRVFITGMGMISAIGNTVAENRQSLMQSASGISQQSRISSRYAGQFPFGEVAFTDEQLKASLGITNATITRTILLALFAFDQAVKDAGLSKATISSPETAMIGATTVGGMCLMDQLYIDANNPDIASPFAGMYDCASVNLYLQKHYALKGIVNTINTACSSSANAIMYGARLIKNGFAKRAIVGGVDSLSKFTINGFNALHILSPELCKPFDRDREGLNLGEGSAFLVLEKEEDCLDKKRYAELTGYGNSNDAFHPSSLSDEGNGPRLAMEAALKQANLNASQIDFINAHGTGTENNDEVESRAMCTLFGTPPPFVSTKSSTGHTLGASGAIEAVYSIVSLDNQEIYPALNFEQPIAATELQPVTVYQKKNLQHVMSNSFGFGGNCTSLIFSKA